MKLSNILIVRFLGGGNLPRIARQSIEELNRVADIVDVVSGYVQLKPASGSFKGLCPFHHEKTPSFHVSPTKQLYHCFGCGAGGGVIDFVMRAENLDYVDALRFLADKYNIVLQEEQTVRSDEQARRHELRKRIYAINKAAARFYYDLFMSERGRPAQEYARRRGLSNSTINKFGIGYAPDSWTALSDMLSEQGFSEFEVEASGLVVKKDGKKVFDRFRNRLMFPIIDVRGNVIGFGGRAMDDGVKYLNSPESPVFHKGYNVFGLNLAKNIGLKEGLILVEGYMDAVSLHQSGIPNVVAGLGTALTPDQARLLKRYASEVYVCYDNDEAGQKAALRAIDILESEGNRIKVVQVAGVKDPDEYMQKKGVEGFRELVRSAKTATAFRIGLLRKQYDLTEVAGKVAYAQAVAELLTKLDSEVERDAYARQVAQESGIALESIKVEINKRTQKNVTALRKTAVAKERREMVTKARTQAGNPAYKAERMLLNLIFFEKKAYTMVTQLAEPPHFTDEIHQKLYNQMMADGQARGDAQMFLSELDEELRAAAAQLLYDNYAFQDGEELRQAVTDCLEKMQLELMKVSATDLSNKTQASLTQVNEWIKQLKKGGA